MEKCERWWWSHWRQLESVFHFLVGWCRVSICVSVTPPTLRRFPAMFVATKTRSWSHWWTPLRCPCWQNVVMYPPIHYKCIMTFCELVPSSTYSWCPFFSTPPPSLKHPESATVWSQNTMFSKPNPEAFVPKPVQSTSTQLNLKM